VTPPAPIRARTGIYNNRFVLFVNDEPAFPMLYALTGGGWRTWEDPPRRNIRNFAEQGFRLFQIDIYLRDLWAEDGSLDMDRARRCVRGVTDQISHAVVFIRLNLDAPFWWIDRYPEECVGYSDGELDEEFKVDQCDHIRRQSFASDRWRRETAEKVVAFLNALSASPEGDAIGGFHVAGGAWGEWFWFGFPHEPDTGAAMTQYFRAWLRSAYGNSKALQTAWGDASATFETAVVPGMEPRTKTQAGVFRDPRQERWVIDYGRCHQECLIEAIESFCRLVKETWPRPTVTGVFYAYFCHIYDMVSGGHLESTRALESPWIDYFSSPVSYELDSLLLGGSGHFRCLTATLRAHGKLWLNEMDQATPLGDSFKRPEPFLPASLDDAIQRHRRNTAHCYTLGQGMWFYDFGPEGSGGWWDHPELLAEVRRLRELGDARMETPWQSAADVLLVYDTQCFYYLGLQRHNVDPVALPSINRTIAEAYRSGAIFDTVHIDDLPRIDLAPYKVVVFAYTPFLTDERRSGIRERVACDGRTIIWTCAPGYTDGETLDLGRMSDLIGMQLGLMHARAPRELHVPADTFRAGFPDVFYGIDQPFVPFFHVDDDRAETVGRYTGGRFVALARRAFDDHIAWFCGLPLRNPCLMRELFRAGGAHIWSEHNDALFASADLLCVHTHAGGDRRFMLPSGTALAMTLAVGSTTLIDATTGEVVLG